MATHTYGIIGEIADYLATQLSMTVGGGIYIDFLPDTPVTTNDIALYERPGNPNIISNTLSEYRFQIYIRNSLLSGSRPSLRNKLKAVYDLLHNQTSFLAYSSVSLCQSVNFPGHIFRNPESGRFEGSLDFIATVKESFA